LPKIVFKIYDLKLTPDFWEFRSKIKNPSSSGGNLQLFVGKLQLPAVYKIKQTSSKY